MEYSEYQLENQRLSKMLRDGAPGLRDQLDTLATDFDPSTVTQAQFERLIKGILRGDDWRYGVWK